jgi:hypothetical protein
LLAASAPDGDVFSIDTHYLPASTGIYTGGNNKIELLIA